MLPTTQPELPSIRRQAASFFGALKDWVKAGAPVANREERARRRGICEVCPRFNAEMNRCMVCGCKASIKPWLLTAECPEDRWNKTV